MTRPSADTRLSWHGDVPRPSDDARSDRLRSSRTGPGGVWADAVPSSCTEPGGVRTDEVSSGRTGLYRSRSDQVPSGHVRWGRVRVGRVWSRAGAGGWLSATCVLVTLLLLALLAAATLPAHAVEPRERLADPALEARARAISGQLRCLVCQNESIDESGADLAHDIRVFVRQRLTAGDTDAQAIQAIVARYGAFVLLKPPVEPATYLLWYGPPALVVLALAGTLLWLRRRQATPAEAVPLSPEERGRLDGLMHEGDV